MPSSSKSCDCTKLPFKKECLKFCIELILRKATPEEKITILGLDAELAYAIRNVYLKTSVNSFEDLERMLHPHQIDQLISKFSALNQAQLDYFNRKK
jgi:hypothetical protein